MAATARWSREGSVGNRSHTASYVSVFFLHMFVATLFYSAEFGNVIISVSQIINFSFMWPELYSILFAHPF